MSSSLAFFKAHSMGGEVRSHLLSDDVYVPEDIMYR